MIRVVHKSWFLVRVVRLPFIWPNWEPLAHMSYKTQALEVTSVSFCKITFSCCGACYHTSTGIFHSQRQRTCCRVQICDHTRTSTWIIYPYLDVFGLDIILWHITRWRHDRAKIFGHNRAQALDTVVHIWTQTIARIIKKTYYLKFWNTNFVEQCFVVLFIRMILSF